MTPQPPARRAAASPCIPRWEDAAYAPGATAPALLLLWYLHGAWLPWWALACGLGSGIVLRRVVAQGYAAFPPFLKRPLDAGVALVGTFLGCWITLVGYPIPYRILRWREALALPAAAALLGLGIAAVVYTFHRLQQEIEEREARLAALRAAELHARLRALQAQINPHFLFNALNSLAEMVHGDADEAEARLPSPPFVRISRSAVVQLSWVEHIDPAASGTFEMVLRSPVGMRLAVSRRRGRRLRDLLGW